MFMQFPLTYIVVNTIQGNSLVTQ